MSKSIPELIFYSGLLNSVPDSGSLFLKMACGDWKLNPGTITDDICTGLGPLITRIYVPAPKDIEIGNSLKYADDVTALSNQLQGIGILEMPFAESEFGQRKLDFNDSIFLGADKRKYNLKFTLVADNINAAKQISEISKTLQALSLPTIESGYNIATSPRMFTPPLWRFGIGKGVGTKISYDWMGQITTCVLQSVRINPTAGGFPYAVASPETPLPLMVSFSLGFIEYQPVFRKQGTNDTIVTRIQAIIDSGGTDKDSSTPPKFKPVVAASPYFQS